MKALGIRQPWAWAIMHAGATMTSARGYGTSYRGPLLVHATEVFSPTEYATAKWFMRSAADGPKITIEVPRVDLLPRRAIVGECELVDVVRQSDDPWWFDGPFAWVVRNPRPFAEPIPLRGARAGLFDVDDEALR